MKKFKYVTFGILCSIIGTSMVYAAPSATLSVSSNNIVNGNTVTATVTLKETMAWDVKIISSGNTSGCSQSFVDVVDSNTTKRLSVTCKATDIGSITFKMSGAISNSNREKVNINGSKTVTVVKPREKSNNNNLKSLGVDGYDLTPGFNKDTLEYSVELPADATKINIYASKEDGYASVSGTGEKDVIEGDNRFEIVVTSETGKSKTYIVNANVKDNNPIIVKVDNKELTVVKRIDSLTKPSEEYVDKKVTISEIEIPAFYNEKNNLTLIGLKDDKGIISLYKYDEKNKKYSKYEELISKSITIISEKVVDIPKNYKETTIKIDDKEYTVYKDTKNQNISLIYGLNLETGKKNWYQYDEEEKTLQINDNSEIESLIKDYESKIDTYKLLIIGLGSLTILLLIIILILIVKKSKKKKK